MADPTQDEHQLLLHLPPYLPPPQLLGSAAHALGLPAADDALPTSPPPFSPTEADAIAYMEALLLDPSDPPAQLVPASFPFVFAPASGAGPSSAGSAAQSPVWGAVAAAPAATSPNFPLSQAAADAASAYVFPDPSAAIAAAADLPTRWPEPHVATLTSGLESSDVGSTFLNVPVANAFVDAVCRASQFVPPEKLMTFLDGGDGCKGILTAFRLQRAIALQALDPDRTRSSVSGSAYEDGRYFAGQIFIRLIESALEDVVMSNPEASMPLLPEAQQQEILGFREILADGGVRELMRRSERKADSAADAVRAVKLAEKEEELLAVNNGRPLSSQQLKTMRNAASSARSNERRKQLYFLTRTEAKNMLLKRWELHNAFEQTMGAWPHFSSSREFAPIPEA